MYKYKASIVTAVYNVESFLPEAVDSIIQQDIGFENIQLILVDDGSSDNSGAICDEYAAKYPDNIVVIHKENSGVSSARNEGLQYVEGKYVSVFDSDDKLSKETVRLVYEFFEAHSDEIDLVAIPLIFFDGRKGEHALNTKFKKGTRVIDLTQEWEFPQLSMASTFVKASVMQDLRFDVRLKYAEDAQLIAKILFEKQKMGVVAEAKYLYRKRSAGPASAIQSMGKTWDWFLPCIKHFNEHTINDYKAKLGYIPRFIQCILMYDLQFKFKQEHIPKGILTPAEEIEYKKRLFALLSHIDDEVILCQPKLALEQKIHLIRVKHPDLECKAMYSTSSDTTMLTLNDTALCDLGHFKLKVSSVTFAANGLEITGEYAVPSIDLGTPRLYAVVNGERISATLNNHDHRLCCVNDPICEYKGFTITIPLTTPSAQIQLVLAYDSFEAVQKNIVLGKDCPISKRLKHSYCYQDGYKLVPTNSGFHVKKISKLQAWKAEFLLLNELIRKKGRSGKKAALCRMLVHVVRPFFPKNIWLLTGNTNPVDECGEAFFLYCTKNKEKSNCCPVLVISKNSPDYARLNKYGKVVPYMSLWHKLLYLLASRTIFLQSCAENCSPVLKPSHYYCDLLQNHKSLVLPHSITTDCSSGNPNNENDWQRVFEKIIALDARKQ